MPVSPAMAAGVCRTLWSFDIARLAGGTDEKREGRMLRLQFSLGSLSAIVAVVAVLLAALIHPTGLLGSAALTGDVTLLVFATLALAAGGGPDRRFWLGFTVVGWAYFVLVFAEPFKLEIGQYLLTSHLLRWAGGGMAVTSRGELTDFNRFGHSLINVLLATGGGALARFRLGRNNKLPGNSERS